MTKIRYIEKQDKQFWFKLDKHLPEKEFENKIKLKQGYILEKDSIQIGILRYNLFWDSIPFCTMLYIDEKFQNQGFGSILLSHWENDMKKKGYRLLLTSTRSDETSQHFYRKAGYKDCGGLILSEEDTMQTLELFLSKYIC